MTVTGCVPCYNNADTVGKAIVSLQAQTRKLDEILLVDDASTDGSRSFTDIRVVKHSTNQGRGAARDTAVKHSTSEALLFCDATCALAPDFLARALPWLQNPQVAAVCGGLWQESTERATQRWQARHLFKQTHRLPVSHRAPLITSACLLRISAIRAVGGFNRKMRACEDAELGGRLLDAGFDIVAFRELRALPQNDNSVAELLERYARWNAAGPANLRGYLKNIAYSAKVMAVEDMRHRDPLAALISLLCPHYQLLASLKNGYRPKV